MLVAHRERHQDARAGCLPEYRKETRAHRLANALYAVAGRIPLADFLLLAALPHIARRPDPALEEPGFIVEPVRIHAAVRALEPDGEKPPLPRVDARGIVQRRRRFVHRTGVSAAIPGQQQFLRQFHVRARRGLDVEFEPHAALADDGQAGNDPGHDQVAPFQFRRKAVGHAQMGKARRPMHSPAAKAARISTAQRSGRNAAAGTHKSAAHSHGSPAGHEGNTACCCSHHTPAAKATIEAVTGRPRRIGTPRQTLHASFALTPRRPMPRKHFRKYLPTHAWVHEHRWFGRFGRFLGHPTCGT